VDGRVKPGHDDWGHTMKLDLKNKSSFTVDNFRQLIAAYDDSVNRQLAVSRDGWLYFRDNPGNPYDDTPKFYLEIWCIGNGYCGPVAALDDSYVTGEFENISKAWEQSYTGMLDYKLQ
jgi:hypothetical protein